MTDRGDCSVYRYGVIVDRGQARYAGSADFTVNGSIASNGTVRASISRGAGRADIQGRLGQGTGSGRWHTAGESFRKRTSTSPVPPLVVIVKVASPEGTVMR